MKDIDLATQTMFAELLQRSLDAGTSALKPGKTQAAVSLSINANSMVWRQAALSNQSPTGAIGVRGPSDRAPMVPVA